MFTNLTGVGNIEVNAFQRLSDVVVQKSVREGFGLVVSEAMWKGTPVVAGRAGWIPPQMADGELLVDSVEECARSIADLLGDQKRAEELVLRTKSVCGSAFCSEYCRSRFLKDPEPYLRRSSAGPPVPSIRVKAKFRDRAAQGPDHGRLGDRRARAFPSPAPGQG